MLLPAELGLAGRCASYLDFFFCNGSKPGNYRKRGTTRGVASSFRDRGEAESFAMDMQFRVPQCLCGWAFCN